MQSELRYHPSCDQLELVGAFDEALGGLLPLARLHDAFEESDGVWDELHALGLFGIATGEELGGSGLGAAEEALIAIGLGRRLASPGILATIGATHAGAQGSVREGRLLRTAAGYRRDGRTIVIDGKGAELILLREDQGASLIEAGGGAAPLDARLWLAEVAEVAEPGAVVATFDAAQLLRLRLIDAAALAGIAEAALEMAVSYAGFREQFGRPIGSFQAVKHQCADLAIAARCARDQVSYAAVAIDDGREDAALQVECALLAAGNAAIDGAGKNIQIHGGIGFSDEADPHLLIKRAQVIVNIAGGLEAATARIADIAPAA